MRWTGLMAVLAAAPRRRQGLGDLRAACARRSTPLTKGGLEDGADIQLGWRGSNRAIGRDRRASLTCSRRPRPAAAPISPRPGSAGGSREAVRSPGLGRPSTRAARVASRTGFEPIWARACCSRPSWASASSSASGFRSRRPGSMSATRSCWAARIPGWTASASGSASDSDGRTLSVRACFPASPPGRTSPRRPGRARGPPA